MCCGCLKTLFDFEILVVDQKTFLWLGGHFVVGLEIFVVVFDFWVKKMWLSKNCLVLVERR